jgi:inositol-phosphate phosphatase/L-galactose 1-phosphate phosphatase/histidinol-phosphatase
MFLSLFPFHQILGIIDQPVLKERWIGITGKKTTLNGQEVSTRTCADLSQAYLYTFLLFPL